MIIWFKIDKISTFKKIINEERNVIFLSKKKNKKKLLFYNHLNLNIGFLNKTDFQKKKYLKKKFMLGDTDSFITIK